MPSLLTNLRSLVFGESDKDAVIRALERKLKAKQARLLESYDYADTLLDPLERYRDGDRLCLPAGYLRDRQRGDSWPLLRTQEDLRRYRGESRVLCDTNTYAAGMLDRLVDFVIGDGHQPTITLRGNRKGAVSTGVQDRDGDGQPDADPRVEACQRVVDEFRELNDWGSGADDREAEGYRRSERDGEVFLRFFAGDSDTNGLPRVRWVEPEQIDWAPSAEPWQSWGIDTEKDDVETVKAYYVRDLHDLSGPGEWVSADKILFHKLNTDRTVKRGLPSFLLVIEALQQASKVNRNMAEVIAIQAAIAYVRQHGAGTLPSQITQMISDNSDFTTKPRAGGRAVADRNVSVQFADPGQVVDISDGMQFVAGPVSSGVPGFIQGLQSRLREVCARFGMPEFFTGDASNNNYASILVSGGPFERSVKRRQKRYAGFQQRVYRRALWYAVQAGRLSEAEYRAVQVEVVPPGVSIANKLEEAQIRDIEVKNGTLSVQTAMVEAGRDPRVELANIEAVKPQQPMGLGGGPDDDPFGGDGGGLGGGGDPFGGLSESALREYTQPEYEALSEADRSHLVFDRTKKRWVNPNKVLNQNVAAKAAHDALKKTGRGEVLDWNRDPKTGKTELLVKRPDGKREILTADEVAAEIQDKGVSPDKAAGQKKLPWGKKTLDQVRAELPKTPARLTVQQTAKALKDLGVGEVNWQASRFDLTAGQMVYAVRQFTGRTVRITSKQIRDLLYPKKGRARESWRPWQYEALSEADRSHLVFDRTKKRWVNPNREMPGTGPSAADYTQLLAKLDTYYRQRSQAIGDNAVELANLDRWYQTQKKAIRSSRRQDAADRTAAKQAAAQRRASERQISRDVKAERAGKRHLAEGEFDRQLADERAALERKQNIRWRDEQLNVADRRDAKLADLAASHEAEAVAADGEFRRRAAKLDVYYRKRATAVGDNEIELGNLDRWYETQSDKLEAGHSQAATDRLARHKADRARVQSEYRQELSQASAEDDRQVAEENRALRANHRQRWKQFYADYAAETDRIVGERVRQLATPPADQQ